GLVSAHQLLQVTTNQAEPFAGDSPNGGIAAPGASSTAPASGGTAVAWVLTDTEPPASSSRVTLRGVPESQQGPEPASVTTTAPASAPPAPWKPRNIAFRSAARHTWAPAGAGLAPSDSAEAEPDEQAAPATTSGRTSSAIRDRSTPGTPERCAPSR